MEVKFIFGDIVVVDDSFMDVIVKTCQKVTGGFLQSLCKIRR